MTSFQRPGVVNVRLAQIKLALDPAPRFILELSAAPQLVDAPPLGSDQMQLDLGALVRAFTMAVIAIDPQIRELEPICVVTAERLNGLLNEIAFGGKRIEARDRRLDSLPARLV